MLLLLVELFFSNSKSELKLLIFILLFSYIYFR